LIYNDAYKIPGKLVVEDIFYIITKFDKNVFAIGYFYAKISKNFGKYYLFKGYVQMRKIKIINYFPLFFMLFIVILRVFFVSSSAEVANTADTNIKLLQNSEAPFKYGDLMVTII